MRSKERVRMRVKKVLTAASMAGAAALLLAGCSQAAPNSFASVPVAGSSSTAKSTQKAAAPDAKPFNAGGLLAGNANPTFPAGDAGKVAVVAQGPLLEPASSEGATLLIAYRNNTNAAVSHVDFSVTANAGGKVVASGESQTGSIPAQVQPGEVALDYIYFENVASMPDTGVTYDFTVRTSPANTSFYNTAPFKVTQADNNGSAIIGAAVNNTGKDLTGPYGVYVYCFDGNNLTNLVQDYATPDGDLAAGGQAAFTVNLYDAKCDTYALGVSGYFK